MQDKKEQIITDVLHVANTKSDFIISCCSSAIKKFGFALLMS